MTSLNQTKTTEPIEENKFKYKLLTLEEQDENKCKIILHNHLSCGRKAYAMIDKFPVCKNHFELEKSLAKSKNQTIEEISNNEPNTNTTTSTSVNTN